jgi:hypothetical protein
VHLIGTLDENINLLSVSEQTKSNSCTESTKLNATNPQSDGVTLKSLVLKNT